MVTTGRKFENKSIKFIKDWKDEISNGSVTLLAEYENKSIVCSHTKRYHNCLYRLAGIGSCARDLMDFLAEEMDNENMVSTNSYTRQKFIKSISDFTKGEINYSDSAVKKSLSTLSKKELIRQFERGVFVVNPIFFWKNDEKNREKTIKLELEFKAGSPTKLLLLQEKYGVDVKTIE